MNALLALACIVAATDRFELNLDEVLQARSETSARATSASFRAVKASDIYEQHLSLQSYLEYVPGFDVRPAHLQNSPAVRGIPGSLSLLIDGVATNSPYDYRIIADQGLFLEEFDRVEVTTGPAGVLWGPYSLLGAINLLSDDSRKPGTSVRSVAGTRGLQRVSVRSDLTLGPGRLKLFVGYTAFQRAASQTDGSWTGLPPYSPTYDSTRDSDVPGAPPEQRLVASLRYTTNHIVAYARLPLSIESSQLSELGGILDEGSPSQRRTFDPMAYVAGSTSFADGSLIAYSRLTWIGNRESIDRRLFADSPTLRRAAHDRVDFQLHRFSALAELRHTLERSLVVNRATVGADSTLETLSDSVYYQQTEPGDDVMARLGPAFRDATNFTGSVYGLNEIALWRRFTLGLGGRYNLGGDVYRNILLRQAGATVQFASDTFLRLVFTEGMRPPQFPDRQGINPIRGVLLRPERSSALLLEAQGALAFASYQRLTARVALSRSIVENLIVRDSNVIEPFRQQASNGVGYLVNAIESFVTYTRGETFSAEGTYRFNYVADRRVSGTTAERDQAAALNNRCGVGACANTGPRHKMSLVANTHIGNVTVFGRGRAECGGLLLTANATGTSLPTLPLAVVREADTMPCYAFADAGVRWAFAADRAVLTFSVTNVGDTRPPLAFATYPDLGGGAANYTTTNGRLVFVALDFNALAGNAW